MPRQSPELMALARLGARQRLQELHAEIETICRQFPGEFGLGGGDKTRQNSVKQRRRFSVATRNKMAQAQRKRWAKVKRLKTE